MSQENDCSIVNVITYALLDRVHSLFDDTRVLLLVLEPLAISFLFLGSNKSVRNVVRTWRNAPVYRNRLDLGSQ